MSNQQEPRRNEIVPSGMHALALRATHLVERGLRDIALFEKTALERDPWQNTKKALVEFRQHLDKVDQKWNELCEAVESGNVELIEAIAKRDPWFLCRASERGFSPVVEALLACGVDIGTRSAFGESALHAAANEGHSNIVELLLNRGADVNATTDDGRTALHETLTGQIKENLQVNLPDTRETYAIIRMLIRGGATVNAKDKDGNTPLDLEIQNGRPEVVSLLRRHSAKLGSEIR